MHALDLAAVLSPLTPQEFFSRYFARTHLHLRGEHGRFRELLPWEAVNSILRYVPLNGGRVHLWRDGTPVPTELFVRERYGRGTADVRPRLLMQELTERLRGDATLAIDLVDELHEPITILAERIERFVQVPVQVNMYAGWGTHQGFSAHFDDHDVIILQVHGKKHWRLFDRTSVLPLRGEARGPQPKASVVPSWEADLIEGDVLYIPRGLRHEAIPCGEPTLHLTVGLLNVTGIDLLTWIVEALKRHPLLRLDVPHLADHVSQADYLAQFRSAVSEACASPALLSEFLRDQNATALARPLGGLPYSATGPMLPGGASSYRVTSTSVRPLSIVPCADDRTSIDVAFQGKWFRFPSEAALLFRYFDEHPVVTSREIIQAFGSSYTQEQLEAFLVDLARHGIVVLTPLAEDRHHTAPAEHAALQLAS